MSAKILEIHIAEEVGGDTQRQEQVQLEAGKGIVGDRYHNLAEAHLEKDMPVFDNHLSLVGAEELDEFMARNGLDLPYANFRRSVITRDIDLNFLVGKLFMLGTALCFGVEPCDPCKNLAKRVHPAVLPELKGKAGLRATVLESGELRVGDSIEEITL